MKLFIDFVTEKINTLPQGFLKIFCDTLEFRNKWYADDDVVKILDYAGPEFKKRQTLKKNLMSYIENDDYKREKISHTPECMGVWGGTKQERILISYKTFRSLLHKRKDLSEYLQQLEDLLFEYMDYQRE